MPIKATNNTKMLIVSFITKHDLKYGVANNSFIVFVRMHFLHVDISDDNYLFIYKKMKVEFHHLVFYSLILPLKKYFLKKSSASINFPYT